MCRELFPVGCFFNFRTGENMLTTLKINFGFAAAVAGLLSSCAVYACDAEILRALQTKYSETNDMTLDQAVFQLACNRNAIDGNASLGAKYGLISLEVGQSSKSVAEACLKKDASFFSSNKQQMGLSFIPEQAIQSCFGGLSLTATQTPSGNAVVVAASYVNVETGKGTKINEFNWEPSGALSCSGANWKHSILKRGGASLSCTRTQNVDVIFNLNTEAGARNIVLLHKPKVVSRKINWSWERDIDRDHYIKCKKNDAVLVGDWKKCDDFGICKTPSLIIAQCAAWYGMEEIEIDGKIVQ